MTYVSEGTETKRTREERHLKAPILFHAVTMCTKIKTAKGHT